MNSGTYFKRESGQHFGEEYKDSWPARAGVERPQPIAGAALYFESFGPLRPCENAAQYFRALASDHKRYM
jgi:hypothetical protein